MTIQQILDFYIYPVRERVDPIQLYYSLSSEGKFENQRKLILDILIDGCWVSTSVIQRYALQYNARIKELRDSGFDIISEFGVVDGKKVTGFRLMLQ